MANNIHKHTHMCTHSNMQMLKHIRVLGASHYPKSAHLCFPLFTSIQHEVTSIPSYKRGHWDSMKFDGARNSMATAKETILYPALWMDPKKHYIEFIGTYKLKTLIFRLY